MDDGFVQIKDRETDIMQGSFHRRLSGVMNTEITGKRLPL